MKIGVLGTGMVGQAVATKLIEMVGGIATARGMAMYLPLWLSLWGALGTGRFNIAVHTA